MEKGPITPKRIYIYCPTCDHKLSGWMTKQQAKAACTKCEQNRHTYTVTCNDVSCAYRHVFDGKFEAIETLGHVTFEHTPSQRWPNTYSASVDAMQCPKCLDRCADWEDRMKHLFQKDATTVTVHNVIIGHAHQLVCANFYGKITDTLVVRDIFTATVRLFPRPDMPFKHCFGLKGYGVKGKTFAYRDAETGVFYAKVMVQCDPNDLRNTGNALYTGIRCKSRCKDPCTYHTLNDPTRVDNHDPKAQ